MLANSITDPTGFATPRDGAASAKVLGVIAFVVSVPAVASADVANSTVPETVDDAAGTYDEILFFKTAGDKTRSVAVAAIASV